MRARDIMTSPVYTVRDDTSIEDAAAMLAARDIAAAPVLDEANEVVGMVSEADLLRNRVPADPAVHPWRSAGGDGLARPGSVADVMTTWVVTARPSDDVADIAQTMLERDIRSIPIIDDGDLVGIVRRRDIRDGARRHRRLTRLGGSRRGGRRRSAAAGPAVAAGPFLFSLTGARWGRTHRQVPSRQQPSGRRADCAAHPQHWPRLQLISDAPGGDLVDTLVAQSRDAALLVAPAEHLGGYDRLLDRWLDDRAVTQRMGRPVLIGIDGFEHCAAAMPLAVEQALLRGAPLCAVSVAPRSMADVADAHCPVLVTHACADRRAANEPVTFGSATSPPVSAA